MPGIVFSKIISGGQNDGPSLGTYRPGYSRFLLDRFQKWIWGAEIQGTRVARTDSNKGRERIREGQGSLRQGMFPNSKNDIPIGMLITEVTFFQDDSAELFGFWYYKEKTIPNTREEKQMLLTDCGIGRCCKLRLMGTARQIEEILLSSEWNPSLKDTWILSTRELIEQCKKHAAIPIELDRVDKPKGIAISMNLLVRLKEDKISIFRKLQSGEDEITLDIAPDWNLGEEIQRFLEKTAN